MIPHLLLVAGSSDTESPPRPNTKYLFGFCLFSLCLLLSSHSLPPSDYQMNMLLEPLIETSISNKAMTTVSFSPN